MHRGWGLFLLLAGMTPALAVAQALDPGRLLASGCFQCHGTGGAKGGFDTLAGKTRSERLKDLQEIRVKSARSNIMVPHARGYTNEQLALMADYFSRQPKP